MLKKIETSLLHARQADMWQLITLLSMVSHDLWHFLQ